MKYCLIPLGCQMNHVDAQRLESVLQSMGYEKTEEEEQADLLGLMACSVRQKAIDKVYTKIHKWNQWKKNKDLLTFVSGCILPHDELVFLKKFDFVFRINDVDKIPAMIQEYGVMNQGGLQASYEQQVEDVHQFWALKPQYHSPFTAYVPIQNGCDKFCTFCAVPYTRGREISRSSQDILNEIQDLVEKGYKSITLLGQNVNSYGLDQLGKECHFAQLLEKIGQLGEKSNKKFWVYFTSPHPKDMGEDVLEMVARYPVLAQQIHLPLQSGDDKVLIKMNRNHSMARYNQVVENIRHILPKATLFTDIIVGFTGETPEQFEHTKQAFEKYHFNMAYIAKYSPRPGAASFRWDDDISPEQKKQRYEQLSQLLMKYSLEYNQKLLGQVVTVLVEAKDRKPGYLSGHSEGKLIIRFPCDRSDLLGQFVSVLIESVSPLSMQGKYLPEHPPFSGFFD